MYRFAVAVCFFFASLVIALFTLISLDDSFQPVTEQGTVLIQDLASIRIWIVILGLAIYSWKSAKGQPTAVTVAVLTSCAWIMFIEDYMVLDSVLFAADHPLSQAVVFTRPIFLVAVTYVAFKQWEIEQV